MGRLHADGILNIPLPPGALFALFASDGGMDGSLTRFCRSARFDGMDKDDHEREQSLPVGAARKDCGRQ